MKKALFFSALLIVTAIFSVHATAQSGWKWGRGTTSYGTIFSEGSAMAIDKSGNVFCGGNVDIPPGATIADSIKFGPFPMSMQNEGAHELFVTKVDSSGNYQWLLCFGGTYSSWATSMVTDTAGNLYVLVLFDDTLILGPDTLIEPSSGSIDCALMKVSPSGSVLWAKKLASLGNVVNTYGQELGIDGAGNIYAAYTALHSTSVAKLNSSGNVLWTSGLGSASGMLYGSMAVAQDGSVYIVGGQYAVKLDSSGHVVWVNTSTATLLIYTAVTTDNQDHIYISGYFQGTISYGASTFTPPAAGGYHILTACLDTSSAIIWARAAYDTCRDVSVNYPVCIGVDRCHHVVVVGSIGYGVVTAPPAEYMLFGTDTLHMPDSSYDPVFVAEYDSSGNYVRSSALTSGGEDFFGAQIDLWGNAYVTSDIYAPKLIVAGDTLVNSIGTGEESFFVAKYHYDDLLCPIETETGVKTVTGAAQEISLYPNPASGSFTISCNEPFSAGTVAELLDMTGRHLSVCSLHGNNTTVPVTGLAPGIYLCRILQGDGSAIVRKVVVE